MTTESFGKALRVQLAKNWEDKGGARGLLGFLMVVSVAIFPPMLALDLLEVPAFTPQRLIPPLLWLAYLAPGCGIFQPIQCPQAHFSSYCGRCFAAPSNSTERTP